MTYNLLSTVSTTYLLVRIFSKKVSMLTKGANGKQGGISCGGRAKVAMGDSSCVGANRPKSGYVCVGAKGGSSLEWVQIQKFKMSSNPDYRDLSWNSSNPLVQKEVWKNLKKQL